ncbi:TonB-dependent receptor [Altericroceibacterium endophyticum]|uniref:TonB-dependent receptor n=1 Tax=Altericroceibacterium endophyticum TaxID=1808508 RepID=A0A6I4T1T4_9SPHN|nr:TonB-dependent receptor [Altericroceibacterium endophyticum]MXO64312.1 TonB-dependent receptor [Altericroceibacterium endophyticum]
MSLRTRLSRKTLRRLSRALGNLAPLDIYPGRSALLLGAMAATLAAASPLQAREASFTVPAGPLSAAIPAFSRDSGVQIIARPEVLRGKSTRGLNGRMSVEDALLLLLRGTGLKSRRRGGVVLIVRAPRPRRRIQQRAPAPATPVVQMEETRPLIVNGRRITNQLSLESKVAAIGIIDALGSDDMRSLPDSTVVDALRRVPGVSVVAIADNEHPRDVPIAPVVRGLTQAYNNITLNGLPIASIGVPDAVSNSASRGGRMDLLPASAISRLMVIKTFTPDLDANAIGGAIDMQTRMPLSSGQDSVLLAETGLSSASQRSPIHAQSPLGGDASLTASHVFGPDRRFGVLIAADIQELDNSSDVHGNGDSNFFTYYDRAGERVSDAALSNGILVPRQDKYWYNASARRRRGLRAAVEAKPSDNLTLAAMAGLYRYNDGYTRNEIIISAGDAAVADQTENSGRFESGAVQVGYRDGVSHNSVRLLQLKAQWEPSPSDQISLASSFSRAGLDEAYEMVKFTAGTDGKGDVIGSAALGFTYDTSGFHHSFGISSASYRDLAAYAPTYWRRRSRRARSSTDALQADWRHDMDGDEGNLGLAAGLSWKGTRYSYSYANNEYRLYDTALSLSDAGSVLDVPLRWNQSDLSLIAIDSAAAWRNLEENLDSAIRKDTTDDKLRDNFRHRERILAAYAMARFEQDGFELLAGLRAEQTWAHTAANRKVVDLWEPTNARSQYLELLPSLLANYRIAERFKLRAAYSRTMGRPGFEVYAPRQSVRFAADDDEGNPDALGVTVNLGNSDIRPRISDNFDLSLEWELPSTPGGLVSLALFRKHIADEIFDAVTTGYSVAGVHYRNATVTQPENASKTHISGFELGAAIMSLDGIAAPLEPFGLSANWTVLRGAMEVPLADRPARVLDRLVGQPSQIGNAALHYTHGALELRAAFNWTGLALRSLRADDAVQDVYWAPRQQIDLQARYRIAEGVSITFEVSNLTEERLVSLTGPNHDWLKDSYSVPRTLRLSVSARIG